MSDGRTESIRVRVSPAEKERLQRGAKAVGVTVSDLMRNRALGISDVAGAEPSDETGESEMAQAAKIVRDLTTPRKHEPGPVERVFG